MSSAVQSYIDAIPSAQRPLFDRIDGLICELFPHVERVISYKMPTYVVGKRRLHVAVWKHGLSLYGWRDDADGGFVDRHPELSSGRGTLRITAKAAASIQDDEFSELVRGALG